MTGEWTESARCTCARGGNSAVCDNGDEPGLSEMSRTEDDRHLWYHFRVEPEKAFVSERCRAAAARALGDGEA